MNRLETRTVRVVDSDFVIRRAELLGRFHLPFEELYPAGKRRFMRAAGVIEFCLAWVWYQWLIQGEPSKIQKTAEEVIAKSIRLQATETDKDWRAEHDLFCAHLAAIAGRREQRKTLAEQMVHAEGSSATDLCQQAWSGFMKFALLGDKTRACAQAKIMFEAQKPINLRLPRKPLVRAWLAEDWRAFNRELHKSYSRMWASAEKNGKIYGFLKISDRGRIEIALEKRNHRVDEHWQENALTFLATEKNPQMPTDSFWLPDVALQQA